MIYPFRIPSTPPLSIERPRLLRTKSPPSLSIVLLEASSSSSSPSKVVGIYVCVCVCAKEETEEIIYLIETIEKREKKSSPHSPVYRPPVILTGPVDGSERRPQLQGADRKSNSPSPVGKRRTQRTVDNRVDTQRE